LFRQFQDCHHATTGHPIKTLSIVKGFQILLECVCVCFCLFLPLGVRWESTGSPLGVRWESVGSPLGVWLESDGMGWSLQKSSPNELFKRTLQVWSPNEVSKLRPSWVCWEPIWIFMAVCWESYFPTITFQISSLNGFSKFTFKIGSQNWLSKGVCLEPNGSPLHLKSQLSLF
jgi:hypothetical protein